MNKDINTKDMGDLQEQFNAIANISELTEENLPDIIAQVGQKFILEVVNSFFSLTKLANQRMEVALQDESDTMKFANLYGKVFSSTTQFLESYRRFVSVFMNAKAKHRDAGKGVRKIVENIDKEVSLNNSKYGRGLKEHSNNDNTGSLV